MITQRFIFRKETQQTDSSQRLTSLSCSVHGAICLNYYSQELRGELNWSFIHENKFPSFVVKLPLYFQFIISIRNWLRDLKIYSRVNKHKKYISGDLLTEWNLKDHVQAVILCWVNYVHRLHYKHLSIYYAE